MTTHYAIADLVVNLTEAVEGEFADWPAEVQDRVYKYVQMENLARGRKYEIVRAYCGINPDDNVPYIHVVVKSPLPLQ